jgi:PAS domain S-box-containing protein
MPVGRPGVFVMFENINEHDALRTILEGTATVTGEPFFEALVAKLTEALGTHGAWVTELVADKRRLRGLAFLMDGEWIRNYEFDIDGTPCATVIESSQLIHFPDRLLELYPGDPDLREKGFVSYLGVPLLDVDGRCLGHMAVVDRRPMPYEPKAIAVFRIFAARAASELQRLRAERDVLQREEKLAGLIASAMDAIFELDADLVVTRANAAAEKHFRRSAESLAGASFRSLVEAACFERVRELATSLCTRPVGGQSLWIPGGMTAIRADGERFPAEASLSRFEIRRETFYTVILRNVDERLAAEREIHRLTRETEYLKEELRELLGSDQLVGSSGSLQSVLRDIEQVAPTGASVLIVGETGTGKELIARAIHEASGRRGKPLVKVNCAAIPATLMESEFFGHEKGAFTGATQRRDGRFALADGGTIFLDEVGELPVDLQVKLLRVLQEGEFEPVGSGQTRRVDVRVIAATNRDLRRAIEQGAFREDLYYRLNVFPIEVPPLRERDGDVAELASYFTREIAHKLGRRVERLDAPVLARLTAYHWPGNVRELQNVIERAVITSVDGRLNLDRALPEAAVTDGTPTSATAVEGPRIQTAEELLGLERQNILRALDTTGWKVAGKQGAAEILGMKPSTLSSRMRALGIQRP